MILMVAGTAGFGPETPASPKHAHDKGYEPLTCMVQVLCQLNADWPISPFGAASPLSATGGVVRYPPRFLPARSWDAGVPATGWLCRLNAMQSAELGLEDLCWGMAAADSSGDDGERACDQPRSEDDEEEPPYGHELVGVP